MEPSDKIYDTAPPSITPVQKSPRKTKAEDFEIASLKLLLTDLEPKTLRDLGFGLKKEEEERASSFPPPKKHTPLHTSSSSSVSGERDVSPKSPRGVSLLSPRKEATSPPRLRTKKSGRLTISILPTPFSDDPPSPRFLAPPASPSSNPSMTPPDFEGIEPPPLPAELMSSISQLALRVEEATKAPLPEPISNSRKVVKKRSKPHFSLNIEQAKRTGAIQSMTPRKTSVGQPVTRRTRSVGKSLTPRPQKVSSDMDYETDAHTKRGQFSKGRSLSTSSINKKVKSNSNATPRSPKRSPKESPTMEAALSRIRTYTTAGLGSPRLHTPRNQTEERPIASAVSSLELVSSKKEDSFSIEVRKELRDYLEPLKKGKKYPITATIIETTAHEYFISLIDTLYSDEKNSASIESGKLQETESPRALHALIALQQNCRLLQPLIERLRELWLFHEEILNEKKQTSLWCNAFNGYLLALLNSQKLGYEENPLQAFGNIIETMKNDEKSYSLFVLFMGGKKNIKNTIAAINKWGDPRTAKILKPEVHKMDWLNIGASNIPYRKHEWFQTSTSEMSISKCSLEEVYPSFIQDDELIFKKIWINDKPLNVLDLGTTKAERQKEFFFRLFKALYSAGLDTNISEEEIKNQARIFNQFAGIVWDGAFGVKEYLKKPNWTWIGLREYIPILPEAFPENLRLKLRAEYEKADQLPERFQSIYTRIYTEDFLIPRLPCFKILKLCTLSCWTQGHNFLVELFPQLFYSETPKTGGFHSGPYTKVLSKRKKSGIDNYLGAILKIKIANKDQFSVTQLKTYATYGREGKEIDIDNVLAKTIVKWTLSPCGNNYKGVLQLPKIPEVDPNVPITTKTKILEGFVDYNEDDDFLDSSLNSPRASRWKGSYTS